MQPSTPVTIQTTYDELLSIERTKNLLTVATLERDKAKNTIKDLLAEIEATDAMLEELRSLVNFFTTENYLIIDSANHIRFRELLGVHVFEEAINDTSIEQ